MPQNIPNSDKRTTTKTKNLFWFSAAMSLLLIFILAAGYFAVSLNTQKHKLERFKLGGLAALETLAKPPAQPQQVFFDANKNPITLSQFHGKILVVNIWATWCGPCVEEMPSLAKLHEGYKDKPINIIAISVDRSDFAAEAQNKLAELSGGKLSFYHDPMMRIAFSIQAKGFPTTIIYDTNGTEITRISGAADWNSAEAHGLIDSIIKSD